MSNIIRLYPSLIRSRSSLSVPCIGLVLILHGIHSHQKRMGECLQHTYPLLGRLCQRPLDKVLGGLWYLDVLRECQLVIYYLLCLLLRPYVPRNIAHKQLVGYQSHSPYVHKLAVSTISNHLRRKIQRSPALSLVLVVDRVNCPAEIAYLHHPRLKKNVLRLYIAVGDV